MYERKYAQSFYIFLDELLKVVYYMLQYIV